MSDTEKLIAMLANNAKSDVSSIGKTYSFIAWALMVIGFLLTISGIGAIFGVPLLLLGVGLFLYVKSMKKRMSALGSLFQGASTEVGEQFARQRKGAFHAGPEDDEKS